MQDWVVFFTPLTATWCRTIIHLFSLARLSLFSEETVPLFGPTLPCPPIFHNHEEFREFLLVKCEYNSFWYFLDSGDVSGSIPIDSGLSALLGGSIDGALFVVLFILSLGEITSWAEFDVRCKMHVIFFTQWIVLLLGVVCFGSYNLTLNKLCPTTEHMRTHSRTGYKWYAWQWNVKIKCEYIVITNIEGCILSPDRIKGLPVLGKNYYHDTVIAFKIFRRLPPPPQYQKV